MATIRFDDGKPTSWSFKMGRHNSASRHRGEHGLWYMLRRFGEGRTSSKWKFYVFPDSVSVPNYEGKQAGVIFNEDLLKHAILILEGTGGFDIGKSAASRGGFRPSREFSYECLGKAFDGALLRDGDEFISQVFGWELSKTGIQSGYETLLAEIAAEEARIAAEKEARSAAYQAQRKEEQATYQAKVEEFKAIFGDDFDIPEGFDYSFSDRGLNVWLLVKTAGIREYKAHSATLNTVEELEAWRVETLRKIADQAAQRQQSELQAQVRASEFAAKEQQVTDQKKLIGQQLQSLEELIRGL